MPRFGIIPHPRRWLFGVATLLVASLPISATPEKWTVEIDMYTKADAARPPAKHAVVFIGSSSIKKWTTLARDFPGIATINRGFGGSEMADSVFYADRIVIPYEPRLVVVYAGENDLWAGQTPEKVAADAKVFREKIHAALPQARIIYLSIKESPSRTRVREQVLRANALIATDYMGDPRCGFVDVASPMLDPAGQPRPALFLDDQLHLKPAGYAIWTKALAPFLAP